MIKKNSWIIVLMLVLTMTFVGCLEEVKEELPTGEITEIFDLQKYFTDQGLAAGETDRAKILNIVGGDDNIYINGADSNGSQVDYSIVSNDGKLSMQLVTKSNWAGLDLRQLGMKFGPTDTVFIKGKVVGAKGKIRAQVNMNSNDNLQSWEQEVEADAGFEKTFTLTSEDVGKIKSGTPQAIRIRLDGTGTFQIEQVLVKGPRGGNVDPELVDFTIDGSRNQVATFVTGLTITANTGYTTGAITIYYEGTDGTTYTKKTAVPQEVGKYKVTFDVAAATGFNAKAGFDAGILTVTEGAIPPIVDTATGDETLFVPSPQWTATDKYTYNNKKWWVFWRKDSGTLDALNAWATTEGAPQFTSAHVGPEGLARIHYIFDDDTLEAMDKYDNINITYDLINIEGTPEVLPRRVETIASSPGASGALGGKNSTLEAGIGKILTFKVSDFLSGRADGALNIILANANQGLNLIRITKVTIAMEGAEPLELVLNTLSDWDNDAGGLVLNKNSANADEAYGDYGDIIRLDFSATDFSAYSSLVFEWEYYGYLKADSSGAKKITSPTTTYNNDIAFQIFGGETAIVQNWNGPSFDGYEYVLSAAMKEYNGEGGVLIQATNKTNKVTKVIIKSVRFIP